MALTIVCDVDSTLLDLHGPWLEAYNRDYDDDLSVENMIEWDMSRVVKPACGRRIYDYLAKPGLFRRARSFPGAIEGLRALCVAGHRVYVASDCFFPVNAKEKMEWCIEMLPFVPRDRIVLGAPKHLLRADVFIDDSPGQVARYRTAWGRVPLVLTLGFPYNECVESLADVYARDWRSSAEAWRLFAEAIRERDETLHDGCRAPVVEHSPIDVGGTV